MSMRSGLRVIPILLLVAGGVLAGAAIRQAHAQAPDWRFGFEYIEFDPPFASEAEHDTLLSRLAWVTANQETAGGINIDGIGGGWNGMQASPTAPINFSESDAWVRRIQDAGFEVVWNFQNNAPWSYAENHNCIDGPGSDECAPDSSHEAAWFNYVKAIVERYDGDGVNDMPGLRVPVRYYIMHQEIYFNGQGLGDAGEAQGVGYWDDNVTDLVRLHRITWRAIHEADPSGRSKLVGSGGWLFDLYGDFPDYPEVDGPTVRQRLGGDNLGHVTYTKGFDSLVWLIRQLGDTSQGQTCDYIGWHPHSGWKASDQSMKLIRTYAPSKPIFIDDMWSSVLTDNVPHDGYLQFLQGIVNERDMPNPIVPSYSRLRDSLNAGDTAITNWYNAKCARDAVKCFATIFGEGAERASFSLSNDCNPNHPIYLLSQAWRHTGLVGNRLTNYAMKPVAYTMRLLVDALHDFTSVSRLNVSDDPYTRVYRFERKRGTPCYVMWSEANAYPDDPAIPNGETVTVSGTSTVFNVWPIITRPGVTSVEPALVTSPHKTFTRKLGFEPIIVEEGPDQTGVEGRATTESAGIDVSAPAGEVVLNVMLAHDADVVLDLYDITGRHAATPISEHLSAGGRELRRDISNLPAGAYVARVHAGATVVHRLLMLRH
ncbi:MAG: hypothetical protein JST22_07430 [Bacteroidetes bacterium]|nr:hypothetical protein [Bacteroidota bacterium]